MPGLNAQVVNNHYVTLVTAGKLVFAVYKMEPSFVVDALIFVAHVGLGFVGPVNVHAHLFPNITNNH